MPKSVFLSSWIRARFSPKTPGGTAWLVIITTCKGGRDRITLAYLLITSWNPFSNSAACQTEIRLSCPVVPADMGVSITTPRTPIKLGHAWLKAYKMSSLRNITLNYQNNTLNNLPFPKRQRFETMWNWEYWWKMTLAIVPTWIDDDVNHTIAGRRKAKRSQHRSLPTVQG